MVDVQQHYFRQNKKYVNSCSEIDKEIICSLVQEYENFSRFAQLNEIQ